jgi:hypothetical protein
MRETNRKKSAETSSSTREGGAKGQDFDDLREDELSIDDIVRFPELRTESQHAQEVVPFTGAHS